MRVTLTQSVSFWSPQMREQLSERLGHLLASVHKSAGGADETHSQCSPQVAMDGLEASEAGGQPARRAARPITTVDLTDVREAECSGDSAADVSHNGHAEQCEQREAAAIILDE